MSDKTRPNLLFVFADQMRGMDMACAGNPDIITPTFDRMAEEGVRSTHHFATCPLCCPNRATMFTGTYATTHGLLYNDVTWDSSLPTLATTLRDAGYRTGYIGKWHMDGGRRDRFTPPGHRRGGFDDFWAVYNAQHEYFTPQYYRDTPELIKEPGYEPEVQTRLAEEFLDGYATDDRPFCLALSWGPPHNPYEQVPDEYRLMYDYDSLRLRQNNRVIPRGDLDPAWSHRPTTGDYYALITSLDDLMGRLLRKLHTMGVSDNTIVVFTSDHGEMLWSQGLLYKCVPYEESINVPLLIRWPVGLRPGTVSDAPVGSVDLMPTLLSMMGVNCPDTVQGKDMASALTGGGSPQESVLVANYGAYAFRADMPTPAWHGLRSKRYTYVEAHTPPGTKPVTAKWGPMVDVPVDGRKPWLLFDNEGDPYQMINLIDSSAHAGVREQLAKDLARQLDTIGDPFLTKDGMMPICRPRDWPECAGQA